MRSLCVAEVHPWPAVDGYRLRLANMIEALAANGPVDLLCLDGSTGERGPAPDGVRVINTPESPESSASTWMPRWLGSSEPRRLVRRNFPEARRILTELASAGSEVVRPDVVFFSHVDSWARTWDLIDAPAIVDFDNLENLLIEGVRELGPVLGPDPSLVERLAARARYVVASGFNRVDERRWDETQRRVASCVNRVLVCSELDVGRSGCPNAVVAPNGYELAWAPADHAHVTDPAHPVLLFVGLLSYSANTDAVQWFATEVMPLVLARVRGAEFRIVGRGSEAVAHLAGLPGVSLVGAVDSLEAELAAADVSVVPIRSGAGTRLKVVEAMANRLPMVSTTIGCEGIEVVGGEHLLIADDAAAFADACCELITDPDRRAAMIAAAQARFEEHYQWSRVRAGVAELARVVAGERPC